MTHLNVILFDQFETLDVFGPVEVFGQFSSHYDIQFYSQTGGPIKSRQNISVHTLPYEEMDQRNSILLLPGGQGTRVLVEDEAFLVELMGMAWNANYILTVCTGAALLAKTGMLNHCEATTNKNAFDWVVSQGPDVIWTRSARWVRSGHIYTSSGISAGIDMALGFMADCHGIEAARQAARNMEYCWNENPQDDPFAITG